MQTVAIRQPVSARTASERRKPDLSLHAKEPSFSARAVSRGFAGFVVKRNEEDDLNNGDPPDLMLWGEE